MKKAPHQAVILIRAENYERLPSGQCCKPSSTQSRLITFTGKDFEEVEKQVEKFLEKINEYKSEVQSDKN